MRFRRLIGVGVLAIWLFALLPELLPALVPPAPPTPLFGPVFVFWLSNYLMAAIIVILLPAVAVWLLLPDLIDSLA